MLPLAAWRLDRGRGLSSENPTSHWLVVAERCYSHSIKMWGRAEQKLSLLTYFSFTSISVYQRFFLARKVGRFDFWNRLKTTKYPKYLLYLMEWNLKRFNRKFPLILLASMVPGVQIDIKNVQFLGYFTIRNKYKIFCYFNKKKKEKHRQTVVP